MRGRAAHVEPATARGAGGLRVADGGDDGEVFEPRRTRGELAELANGDEHAIKFTEALLAEHAISPEPVYLAAAADAVKRL